jgi:hypothetical protein
LKTATAPLQRCPGPVTKVQIGTGSAPPTRTRQPCRWLALRRNSACQPTARQASITAALGNARSPTTVTAQPGGRAAATSANISRR